MLAPSVASALVLVAALAEAPARPSDTSEGSSVPDLSPWRGRFGTYFAYGLGAGMPVGRAEAAEDALLARTGAHGVMSLEGGWGMEGGIRAFALIEPGWSTLGATGGADACGSACRSMSVHLLAGLRLDAAATKRRVTWIALAFGGELLELYSKRGGAHPTTEYLGWELRLQAGMDRRLSDEWQWGPVLGVSAGCFNERSPPGGAETSFRGPLHLWFFGGVRLTLWT